MCGSIQSQFGVQILFFSHDQSLTLSALPEPCCGITLYAKWARMASCHVLGVSRDGVAAVRDRGCFWCGASVSSMPLLLYPGSTPGPGHLCIPQLSLFPSSVSVVPQPDKRVCLPCIAPQAWGTLLVACIACSPGKMSFHVKFHFLRAPSQGHGS